MASAPGPFFSTAENNTTTSRNGPQHLAIRATKEAAEAGFQVPSTDMSAAAAPPPTAYPITVTTAGQTAPALVPNVKKNAPILIQPQKKPFGETAVNSKKRSKPGSGVTLAVTGGFTLPQTALPSAPSKPRFYYSSASRATVKAHEKAKNAAVAATAPSLSTTPSSPCRRVSSAPGDLSVQQQSHKYRKVIGGKAPLSRSLSMVIEKKEQPLSPQGFLDKLIESRGYSCQKFCSLEGGYYCKPSPLQKASYGIRLIQAVRQSDKEFLRKVLDCGLSPNPCNDFGESVVHMVCRRGDDALLKILLNAGCSLQVTDDFGRTPLHDACWTAEPCFECVQLLLECDTRLLQVVDCRGAPPLSYVKKEHWQEWIDFFKSKADEYWPPRDVSTQGQEPPPKLSQQAPHSQTIKDPKTAASIEVASLVASGKLDPQEYLDEQSKQDGEEKQVEAEITPTPSAGSTSGDESAAENVGAKTEDSTANASSEKLKVC